MRGADDFPDYLAARWVPLVRVVVLLGWSRPLAERIAAAALGGCRRDWRELSASGDLDGEVLAAVLDTTAQARRHGLGPDGTGLPLDDDGEHDRAVEALESLAGHERTRLVVAAVLGRGRTDHPALLDDVRLLAALVRVGPPPAPEALPTRLQPRRTGRLVLAGAAVVGLLVTVTYAVDAVRSPDADRPEDERLGPVEVVRSRNPAPVAWWADGVLHLAAVSLRLPDVVDLFVVDHGAVVTDSAGRVVHVGEDGVRTVLGRHVPGTGLAAQPDTALLAWVESGGTVVVHDLLADREVDRRRLDIFDARTGRVVALDGGAVHLTSSFGDVRWAPGDTSTTVVQPPVLVDRASGTALSRVDEGTIRVEQPFFSVGFDRPGRGGRLSPDGAVVVTSVPDARSAHGTVRLYDTRSGDRLATGLGPSDVALASEASGGGTVTHVVARLEDLAGTDAVGPSSSALLELRTCGVPDGRCRTDATVPASDGVPVLAAP